MYLIDSLLRLASSPDCTMTHSPSPVREEWGSLWSSQNCLRTDLTFQALVAYAGCKMTCLLCFFLAAISEPVISTNRRCGWENRNHHQGKLWLSRFLGGVLSLVAFKGPEIMYSVAGLIFWAFPGRAHALLWQSVFYFHVFTASFGPLERLVSLRQLQVMAMQHQLVFPFCPVSWVSSPVSVASVYGCTSGTRLWFSHTIC